MRTDVKLALGALIAAFLLGCIAVGTGVALITLESKPLLGGMVVLLGALAVLTALVGVVWEMSDD